MGNNTSSSSKIVRTYGHKRGKQRDTDVYHDFTKDQKYTGHIKWVDLRRDDLPVYNQEDLGSCTANGIAFAYQYDEKIQTPNEAFMPSRLFVYYNERDKEHSTDSDAGAEIYDGIMVVREQGMCPETMWEYDTKKYAEKPPQDCYDFAKSHVSIENVRVRQTLDEIKSCLYNRIPIVFGCLIYESFESKKVEINATIPMPSPTEKVLGGHCLVMVGYSDEKQCFLVRNSWGPEWCAVEEGHCWMPYDYILDHKLTSDLWTIRKIK